MPQLPFDVLEMIALHRNARSLYLSCRSLLRGAALSQVGGVSVTALDGVLKIVDDRTGYPMLAKGDAETLIRAVQRDKYILLRRSPDLADIWITQNEALVRVSASSWTRMCDSRQGYASMC